MRKPPTPQQFPGMRTPTTDFNALQQGLRGLPLYREVDLSVARSIAAGTQLEIVVTGNSFYADPLVDTAGLPVGGIAIVHFQDTSLNPAGTPFTIAPQAIMNIPFTRLIVENPAQAGKRMRFIFGVDLDFSPGINAQVSISGTVSVSNAARYGAAATDAGNAFMGYVDLAPAAFGHLQIKNPAASGKTVYLDQIDVGVYGINDITELWRFDTDLTTLVGTWINKAGFAAGVAQLRSQSNAGALGTTRLARRSCLNGTQTGDRQLYNFKNTDPIRLDPGQGVLVQMLNGAHTVTGSFEGREY